MQTAKQLFQIFSPLNKIIRCNVVVTHEFKSSIPFHENGIDLMVNCSPFRKAIMTKKLIIITDNNKR